MLNQEIKSKARAKKLSDIIAMDLTCAVNIFVSYTVDVVSASTAYEVEVFSNERCCVITDSALSRIKEVIDCYEMQYCDIRHHLDVKQIGDRFVPSIVVKVRWQKK